MGGLDILVFSGGIGENASAIRTRICERLEFAGIVLDEKQNLGNEGVISTDGSKVKVRVIHTHEEYMIKKTVLVNCQTSINA